MRRVMHITIGPCQRYVLNSQEKRKEIKKVGMNTKPSTNHAALLTTNFHGIGTNCMVHSDWESVPRCVCGPNFTSDLI